MFPVFLGIDYYLIFKNSGFVHATFLQGPTAPIGGRGGGGHEEGNYFFHILQKGNIFAPNIGLRAHLDPR